MTFSEYAITVTAGMIGGIAAVTALAYLAAWVLS